MTARNAQHVRFEELAVGHALSALEPEDEQAFLAHLPECGVCESALSEHLDTLGSLAFSTERSAPPASLLDGIRAGIEASGRSASYAAPIQLASHRRRRLSAGVVRWGTAAVAAAAALVLVGSLVVSNQNLERNGDRIRGENVALTKTVDGLLTAGSQSVPLVGAGGAKAVAVVTGKTVSLVVSGLAANGSDSIYVLWERSRTGDVSAVKAFDVRAAGVTVINGLQLRSGTGPVAKFAVTREFGRTAPFKSTQQAILAGDTA